MQFNQQLDSENSLVRMMQGTQGIRMIGTLGSGSQMRPSGMAPHQQRPTQSSLRPASSPSSQSPVAQNFQGHSLMRPSPIGSPSVQSTGAAQQSLQAINQPWLSSTPQGKPPLPPPTYRPQVNSPSMQQRPHPQQHLSTSTTASQPQQQQSQQQQHQPQEQLQQLRSPQQPLPHPHQPTRVQGSVNQKVTSPVMPSQPLVAQPGNQSKTVSAENEVSDDRVLGKRSIHELLQQIDPSEKLDPEVEDILADIAEDFVESITSFGCSLEHRKSDTLEAKDILLHKETGISGLLVLAVMNSRHFESQMVSTRSQLIGEFSPIDLEMPCKRSQPHHPAKKSVRETGSLSKEKRGKKVRVELSPQLKTPKQTVKRKKVRPRVVHEGSTSKPGVSAAGAKASQSTSCLRPKRSTRRNLSFDFDLQEEDEFCGLDFPKRRRTSQTNDCFTSVLSLVTTTSTEPKVSRKRSPTVTRPRNFQSLKTLLEGIGPQLKAIVSHKRGKLADGQEQKAIVQYMGDGKKKPPKVQLDEETLKVWKLLSLSIHSEGVDGADEDKQKWWREERKIFEERANSFIARMSQVQGDRRFSLWKGSVVDSVVGVFLTQNVADHSSSSVFMDIAAEFPINLNYNKGSCYEERGSSVTHETVMDLDHGNAAATPRIRNPNCIIIQEIDDDEDIDAVSQETSKTTDSFISSTNKMLLDPPTVSFETHIDSEARETVNCDEEEKERACSRLGLNGYQPELEITIETQDQKKKTKTEQNGKKPTNSGFDWDCLKKKAESGGQKRERTEITMDTVDWNAVRHADVNKLAALIRKRGMNEMLSKRIKAFLNRLVLDHGSIDLEWLRDVHPDKAKEYLLSINGLGLKSVECVRLLSLHQIAFPVDTNVGRIAVRLGWVPLQPLPDELQMHLLELYPVLESVQKYLWPRLCKLDQKTLYELHYHMITFGKVFCTKKKPNCEACPMKGECRHYSSARKRLALPESKERTTVITYERRHKSKHVAVNFRWSLFLSQEKEQQEVQRSQNCEPIIEEPTTPEREYLERDIEDFPWDNKVEGCTSKDLSDEISTIILNKRVDTSKDLVLINTQETSIPQHEMKVEGKLCTGHLTYELPDYHYLLQGFERREYEDVVPYMLAIWTRGETPNSIQPPEQRCVSQESNTLCQEKKCFFCDKIREEKSQKVKGTILIPCRTAMKGAFPLNGTYFQTNEVFADHGSSINPIDVPKECLKYLPRRVTYFASSVSSTCKGFSLGAIQHTFQEGYFCVRGFNRENRKSRALVKGLHSPPRKKNQPRRRGMKPS